MKQFDEHREANEFEVALHMIGYYLTDPGRPAVNDDVIVQIDAGANEGSWKL